MSEYITRKLSAGITVPEGNVKVASSLLSVIFQPEISFA
jgi:hypothetical protein